ncbi:MAG: VCBS repeat-containing protein [Planctomycetia bacterium]|nr:VCBS repeat-containing protein [Planctomycetia bacterium]
MQTLRATAFLTLVCLAYGAATPATMASGAEPPGLTAASASHVHPVLIRNEHGPLVRITVNAAEPKDVRVNALSFKLDGTDDLADLDALELFSTGENEAFAATARFGEPARPAAMVTFQGEHLLRPGKNVFWLSCRLKPAAGLSHRVTAACTAVETTAGKIAQIDGSPALHRRIGVALRKHRDDGVHTYRIPALATSSRGTLLCVYDMRRRMGRDLQEDIDIGLSRSTDGGKTWESARPIMDMGEYGGLPQEQNGCSDPGIIVDQKTGEIFCFAVWMNGKPGKHQWNDDGSEPGFEIGKTAQFLMVRSQDDGLTWTKPENLTKKLKQESWWLLAPSPQQGINLPDGTLVMPVQGRDGGARLETFATLMISRDHGVTWTIGNPGYRGGNECQAARLGDGSIMLNIRNDHERFRAVVVTNDLGQTWQPHATNRNTLIEPNCNGSLLRVDYEEAGAARHALLFANPHTQKGRTHQTIQVSFDDGRTWPESHHRLLDEGRGAGYPSLTRIDANHVGIVYEGSQAHLMFEKFSLEELLRKNTTAFSERLLKTGYSYSYGLDAADLDGDGDLDITSSDTRNFKLYWFENEGQGRFRQHLIEDGDRLGIFGPVTQVELSKSVQGDAVNDRWFKTPRLERHVVGDVNSDGKIDVVIVENLHGGIYWYKNSGTPAKSPLWQRFTITRNSIPGAYDVAVLDLDGDGDRDVAVSTWRLSNKFVWFENPGDPEKSDEWKLHVIDENIAEPRTIRAGDFNGDGKPDLLGTALVANLVVWYEHPGDPRTSPWKRHVIDGKSPEPGHGMPADIDGDGDLDVVMALGMSSSAKQTGTREIVWYENDPAAQKNTEWKKHVIAGDFDNAFEAIAVDLDGDGRLDVAATSYAAPHGRAVWFKNPGDPRGKWTAHDLKTNWPRANQIIAADLDGDGKPDLVAGTTGNASEVRWWRNEGPAR